MEYLDEGPSDGRPIVLVHGFPDVPSTWDDVVSLLPPGVRVIRPFLRGVGRSRVTDPAARSGQVAALATDLVDLVDALGLENIVLVGHDWGARASHAVAVLAPHKVAALVTLSTAYGSSSSFPLSAQERLAEVAVAWYRYWLCTAAGSESFRTDPAALVRWAWKHWSPALELGPGEIDRLLHAVDNDDFADLVVHYYRHGAGEAEGNLVYSGTQSILDEWPIISAPTTFLIGTGDGCETLSLARANSGLFSSGRNLVELERIGHFIPREAPQTVADAIGAYL